MKRNYLKRILSASLCMLLIGGTLVGCGSKEEKKEENKSGKIELTAWVRASSKENSQKVTFDAFNESQDKIKVNVESYGDNYAEVLKLAFNSGDAPDIFGAVGIDLKAMVDADLVSPLNDYLTDDYKSEFMDSAFTAFNYDDKVYAIPDMTRFIRIYYNKDLFKKAGVDPEKQISSLEEMYEVAQKITEAGNGDFYGFGLPIKSDSTWERNVDDIAILSALTGPYAFDYVTGKFDFEKQKPILEYFSKMYKDGILMPGSESLDIEMIRANFVAGKIGMYMDGNWMINGFNNEVEGGKDANWDTMLVPVAEGTERAKDYLMLDSAIAMSQGCEEKEAAFEAIQYYLHNYYTAPTEKNPEIILPSSSLIIEDNEKVNSKPEVQALKGMSGIIDEENLAAFPVTPHTVLTLEGDSRDKVYPTLIIDGDSAEMDTELKKLSETYNNALQKALDEGLLKEEDIKPAGFDYYTR